METLQEQEDAKWMRLCLDLAKQAADIGEVPVGAIVVREAEILGEGYNQPVTTSDPSAHAEIQALRSAAEKVGNYRLPGATLYVSVEPCTMCAGALIHSRLSRLVFGTTEARAGAIVSRLKLLDQDFYNHRVEYQYGCLAEDSSTLLKSFFRQRRSK
ncbi:MAG: tRNA adenosine(34) deaminase TadA [Pseudomonadales bacterium]